MSKRISQLPPDSAPDTSIIFEGERAGVSYRETVAQLQALFAASMALTGVPTAPTAAPGTNTTQVATTAFAAAIAALKANIASPAFTGIPSGPTPAVGTNTTQLATAAMIQAEIANKRAWTSYTPTPTAASGTYTSASATGSHMGAFGMRNLEIALTVPNKGTGVTAVIPLPVPAHSSWIGRTLSARQANGSRKMGVAVIQDANSVFLTDYVNADLVEANGTICYINGAYREA